MKSRYVTNFRVIGEKVAKNPVRTTTDSEGVNIVRRRILFFFPRTIGTLAAKNS